MRFIIFLTLLVIYCVFIEFRQRKTHSNSPHFIQNTWHPNNSNILMRRSVLCVIDESSFGPKLPHD